MLNNFKNIFFVILDNSFNLLNISEELKRKFNVDFIINDLIKCKSGDIIKLTQLENKSKSDVLVSKDNFNGKWYICLNLIESFYLKNICNLTNLPNRTALIDYLKSTKSRKNIFICLINLDDFSSINDVYGGTIGDTILQNIGLFLEKTFKDFNIFKLRDDEFAIVSETTTNLDDTILFLEKIINSYFNKPFYLDNNEIRLGSTCVFAYDPPNIVLKHANETLKYGKLHKKNFLTYDDTIIVSKIKKETSLNIINKIKHCINNKLVVPYYQPIIDNSTGKIYKYEALMRLKYNNEIIFPNIFMDLALKSKTYHTLSILIIEKIFKDVNSYGINVSINITMDDINNKETCFKIFDLLQKCQYPENITFEIIETVEIVDLENFDNFLKRIKSYNSKMSIDDFGTGYSNFEYFSRFDFDYLKIDGYFIKDITTNKKHQDIIKSIVSLTKDSNVELIGEFVENIDIYEKIKELGVHYSQGFYFSKPKPIEKLEIKLKKDDNIAC
jgi:c-di-GMP phosphodiesterase